MFNGYLWTVNPNTSPITISNNPDYRNWGNTYFWQNTRLPYASMLARDELDFMQPLSLTMGGLAASTVAGPSHGMAHKDSSPTR